MESTDSECTIEQLAGQAHLPFTTIRLYQQRGLLPPPTRRGRVGYYNPTHLARLQLIAQLQDRGYSLAAIKDLVDTWEEGRTLAEVLTVERAAASVLGGVDTIRLSPEDLARRFGDVVLTPELMQRAYELGLVRVDGDEIVVGSPAFLEVGAALSAMGVPLAEVLDEYEHLREQVGEIAARFTAVFERNVWEPFVAAGMPAADAPAISESLARLTPLAEQIILSALRQALADTATGLMDQQAKAMGPTTRRRGRRP